MSEPHCPVCDATKSRSAGLVRITGGTVAEGRECIQCGERWAIDDEGQPVR